MKILHLSTFATKGGASRSTYRLHKGLRSLKEDSFIYTTEDAHFDPTVKVFRPAKNLATRLRRLFRQARITYECVNHKTFHIGIPREFSSDRGKYGTELLKALPFCHIINLHWVAGYFEYGPFFSSLPPEIPIVWTLHDMNPFTGGCHYDYDCGGFAIQCGHCPQLGSNDTFDLSHKIHNRKRRIFAQLNARRIRIVAPSQWLASEAKRSSLFRRFDISVIPYGLDTDVFSPQSRGAVRDALGIPQDARVILFVAQTLSAQRKGFDLLAKALTQISGLEKLFLISMGKHKPSLNGHIPHLHVGYVDSDKLLSLCYNAADIFAIASLQDNLPNTVLEAMACGIPVVGFNVGGIPDMVRQGVTGFLVPAQDSKTLGSAITETLRNNALRDKLSSNCRQIAKEEYSLKLQASRYKALYEAML